MNIFGHRAFCTKIFVGWEIVLEQKVLQTQIFCCLFLSFNFLYLPKHVLDPNLFLAVNCVAAKKFELKIVSIYCEQKIYSEPKYFTQINFGPIIFSKIFFEHEILSESRVFFWTFKKKKNLFCPNFFLNQSFRPK